MAMEFVNDNDLFQMSHVTIEEFRTECNFFAKHEDTLLHFEQYSSCLDKIKRGFQYPHYYSGLIALLLLFSSDETYDLDNRSQIMDMFQQTKELAVTGYDKYEGFSNDSLEMLIHTLRDMSRIFTKEYSCYQTVISRIQSRHVRTEDCFVHRNGIQMQVKAIDFSKTSSADVSERMQIDTIDPYQQVRLTDRLDCNDYIKSIFKKFEAAYSVRSGFSITTIIGILFKQNGKNY